MANGLDDVVAAETVLSDVDGQAGRLVIRGHSLDDLRDVGFEALVRLLFAGFFPELPAAGPLGERLGAARQEAFVTTRPLLDALAARPMYDAMRAGVALMPDGDTLDDALRLIAAPAVLLPALIRIAAGERPVAPDPERGHAEDIVRMLGRDGAAAPALDRYLVTVSDHGLNASTFAARVVASTQAGLTSSALAGLGALKGPLHGGAPGPVIAMLDAIADAGDARAWLAQAVGSGERLMGFGHRIYRTRDPRADALKAAVRALPDTGGRIAFAEGVEDDALAVLRAHRPGRVLETNVEFYTALLLEAVGFPPPAFTGVFAMGRIAGWIAHAREQALTGRLIRPQSRYVAERPLAA